MTSQTAFSLNNLTDETCRRKLVVVEIPDDDDPAARGRTIGYKLAIEINHLFNAWTDACDDKAGIKKGESKIRALAYASKIWQSLLCCRVSFV